MGGREKKKGQVERLMKRRSERDRKQWYGDRNVGRK